MSSRGVLPPSLGGLAAPLRNPLGDVTVARKNTTVPERGSRLRHLECIGDINEQQQQQPLHKNDGADHSPPKKKLRAPLGPIDIPNDKITPASNKAVSKPFTSSSASFTIFDATQNEKPVNQVYEDKENSQEAVSDGKVKDERTAGTANHETRRPRSRSRRNGRHRRKRSTSPPRRNFPTVSSISSIESVAIPDTMSRVICPAPDPPSAADDDTGPEVDSDNAGDDMEVDHSTDVTATVAPSPPYNPVLPTLGFHITYTPEVTKLLNEGIAMMEQEVLLHILGEDPESMLADRASGTSATRVLHLVNYARKRVKNEVWLRMCANGNYSLENRWNVLKSMIDGIRY